MQTPLELAFEGCEASDAVRAAIEHEIRQLEKHNHHITGARVRVIAPSSQAPHRIGLPDPYLAHNSTTRKHSWSPMRHLTMLGTNVSALRSRARLPRPDGKLMI